MTVFVSYSRRDEQAAGQLLRTLEKAQYSVWVDQQLRGGESWWQEVLTQIRGCSVFLVALSDNALSSTPCRSELDYAMRLGIPILPVRIGQVGSVRSSPVAGLQIVDYASGNPNAGVELMVALNDRREARRSLPDPLPPAPPIPFEYLARLQQRADQPTLAQADQDQSSLSCVGPCATSTTRTPARSCARSLAGSGPVRTSRSRSPRSSTGC